MHESLPPRLSRRRRLPPGKGVLNPEKANRDDTFLSLNMVSTKNETQEIQSNRILLPPPPPFASNMALDLNNAVRRVTKYSRQGRIKKGRFKRHNDTTEAVYVDSGGTYYHKGL